MVLNHKIPAIFFTTGLDPGDHATTDDVEKINFEKMEKIARLAFHVTWRLANQESRPQFQEPRVTSEP